MYPNWLPEPLEPIVARLARVDDCIGDMVDLSGKWSFDGPLELKQLRRADGRYRAVISAVRPIPPAISLLFSEAIHHLRAALDNTVWHLVNERSGPLDERAARSIAMPVFEETRKFAGWCARIMPQVPVLADETSVVNQRVRSLQPFIDKGRVASVGPALEALMGIEAEQVHPLLLLQGYSNLDKHRAISMTVGRVMVTAEGLPFLAQDRSFREMRVGDAVSADGTWGTPVPIESRAAVMVERPDPWTHAVSPATEAQSLRDWVRHEALPRLITGSSRVPTALPVTIELGDDGRTLRQRVETTDRPSAFTRMSAVNAERLAQADARPLQFIEVVDEEFDDC